MKRKILSLILVLMLIPFASVFTACGKDEGYNLNNLFADFNQIGAENSHIELKNKSVLISYEGYNDLKEQVLDVTEPYTELEKYDFILNNIMAFSCEYVSVCSNNELTTNVNLKNEIEANLTELRISMNYLNNNIDMFDKVINNNRENPTETTCLVRFENLLRAYQDVFVNVSKFNDSLADLYFNYALTNSNPNVFSVNINEFDASIVVNKLKSRVSYQKAVLSSSFVEMYISEEVIEKVANKQLKLNLDEYDYNSNISSLNKDFTEATGIERANNAVNKEQFYNLAVQSQNLLTALNNDQQKTEFAFDFIDYAEIVNKENKTSQETLCVEIIESNFELISNYNSVLAGMLNIVA